ncbi:MAG: alpha-E domain-containing protein, partial [Cytophagaceae bacterium]
QCAIVNGYIDHTLIHNSTWHLIQLGIHTEAAGQITRMLISKIKDIRKANGVNLDKAIETYLCITLLKSAEAFDMSRIHYKKVPNERDTLEFLILNSDFPRSIIFNLEEAHQSLMKVQIGGEGKDSPEFFSGRLRSSFHYLTIEDIHSEVLPFLEKTLKDIYKLGMLIDAKFH